VTAGKWLSSDTFHKMYLLLQADIGLKNPKKRKQEVMEASLQALFLLALTLVKAV